MIWFMLRLPFRLLWFFLASTFPIWILPFLNGAIEGIFLKGYELQYTPVLAQLVMQEYHMAQATIANSSPGMLSARKTGLPPYHIPQLRDPLEWYKDLGLVKFDNVGRVDPKVEDLSTVEELYGSMDMFRRKARPHEDGKPWHHWVYVSGQSLRTDMRVLDEWDEVFNDLLQYHYANPPAHNAGFHYVSCPEQSFCDLFRLKAPSLLHFTTEREETTGRRQDLPGHDPVTVRVFELPITNHEELLLAPGVFPSPFNQLRSFTAIDDAWKLSSPFSRMRQDLRRLFEASEEKEGKYLRTYGHLIAWEDKLFTYIGYYNDAIMHQTPRALGMSVSVLLQTFAAKFAWGPVTSFFGSTKVDRNEGDEGITHEIFGDFPQTETWGYDPS